MGFKSLIVILIVAFVGLLSGQKIAVVEYYPVVSNTTNVTQKIEENVNEYRKILDSLKILELDVVVFPEYGLTGLATSYKDFGVLVPTEQAKVADYQGIVKSLSNMAQEYAKSLIIHLVENGDGKLYSTAVVIDTSGKISYKSRKTNPSNEENLKGISAGAGNTVATIAGKNYLITFPEDLIGKANKTSAEANVIVLSSWSNVLPFETSSTVHAGVALAKKQNVFVSALNTPSMGRSGSGAFLYNQNGTLSSNFQISGKNAQRIITSDVPARSIRTVAPSQTPGLRGLPNEDELKDLVLAKNGNLKIQGEMKLVEGENSVDYGVLECRVNITSNTSLESNYRYVIYKGSTRVGSQTFEVHFCGLAVYQNNDLSTCGNRIKSNVEISKIQVELSLTGASEDVVQVYPATLGYNLKPFDVAAYQMNNNIRSLVAENVTDVVVFGFNVFMPSAASLGYSASILLMIAAFILTFYSF